MSELRKAFLKSTGLTFDIDKIPIKYPVLPISHFLPDRHILDRIVSLSESPPS